MVASEQQIGYINVVPACVNPGGVNSRPEFDSQSITLDKFNRLMKHRPMPGESNHTDMRCDV